MTYRLGADGGTRNPLGMHPPAGRPWNNGCCRPPPCCLGPNGTSDGGLRSPAATSVLPDDAGAGAAGDTAADTTTTSRSRSTIMATGLDMVTWRGVRVREEAALDGLAQVARSAGFLKKREPGRARVRGGVLGCEREDARAPQLLRRLPFPLLRAWSLAIACTYKFHPWEQVRAY